MSRTGSPPCGRDTSVDLQGIRCVLFRKHVDLNNVTMVQTRHRSPKAYVSETCSNPSGHGDDDDEAVEDLSCHLFVRVQLMLALPWRWLPLSDFG